MRTTLELLVRSRICRLSEHLSDNFFQRRVLDAYVIKRVIREHGGEHSRDLLPVDTELYARLGHFYHIAVARKVARQLTIAKQKRQHLVTAEAIDDTGERAVVNNLAMVDHNHTVAERGDVFHVVACQKDRD